MIALTFGGTLAPLAAQEKPTRDAIVDLPPYVVTDTRELPPPEAWRYAEIPGFEILIQISDSNARQLLENFQLFNAALGVVWPAIQPRGSVPMALILCDHSATFDAFVPTDASAPTDGGQGKASLFLKDAERAAIVLNQGAAGLNIEATDIASHALVSQVRQGGFMSDTGDMRIDHDKQLYREYVHFLLSRMQPRSPAWLEEGLAQLLMGMKFDKKYIELAKLEDPNLISLEQKAALDQIVVFEGSLPITINSEDRDFQAALGRTRLMTFPEMFAVQYDSQIARNPIGSAWAKQCYAFVHLCLYGEQKRYQKGFLQFMTRLTKEPLSEQLFTECFGANYKSMQTALTVYINTASYQSIQWNVKKGGKGFDDLPPLQLRDATLSEIGRIKGETLALAGHGDKGRLELIAPYIRGERDSRLLAALGLFEHAKGDDIRARKFLEAAVQHKAVRPEAYLELARLRYADALEKPGADKSFSAAQVAAIADLLLIARQQPPHLPGVYELLAETWTQSAEKINRDNLTALIQGTLIFPQRRRLAYQTAELCADVNELDIAHALADRGINHAPNPEVKARFEQLKASLPLLKPKNIPNPKNERGK